VDNWHSVPIRNFCFSCSCWLWGPSLELHCQCQDKECMKLDVLSSHNNVVRNQNFILHFCTAVYSFCLCGCCRGRPFRMKSKESRKLWRMRSDARGVSAELIMMIKLQPLTMTILVTLREVRAAVMCATFQTPGGGWVFLHKLLSGVGLRLDHYTVPFCNTSVKCHMYIFVLWII
jgi:hypothetical protein